MNSAHSNEAELGALCSFFREPERVGPIFERQGITEAHFHHPAHQVICGQLLEMWRAGRPIDLVTVTVALDGNARLPQAGGPSYVTEVQSFIPTAANVEAYLETLEEKRTGRLIESTALEFAKRAPIESDPAALLIEMQQRVSEIPSRKATAESLFADVGSLIAQGLEPERPLVGQVGLDQPLLYSGRVNEIHGEPAVGKTNILLALAIATMKEGGYVVYLDPEDTPHGIIRRLCALGCPESAAKENFFYLHDPSPERYAACHAWCRDKIPDLVVLDGLAEALARESKDENSPTDILTFFRERIRPFTERGSAVVVADHVTKDSETRGRWARGSGAKLGHYDGVSYEASLIEGYSLPRPER